MELGSANCAECCSDCAAAAPACCPVAASAAAAAGCCDASSACCDANCQLLPPDPIKYEYHEPEENFVSIDDAKIKNLLFKIGQQQQQELRRQQQERQLQREQQRRRQQQQQQHQQQIIELLDDDEQQPQLTLIAAACSFKHTRRNSPDIQLIPTKQVEQRVVARIDLIDSECEFVDEEAEEDDDDEEDLPLAAVSCELKETAQLIVLQTDDDEDDEDDDDGDVEQRQQRSSSKTTSRKRAPRPYIKRRIRHYYQCQACGKKVQSNYNLRRHMMIHTGERQVRFGSVFFIFTFSFPLCQASVPFPAICAIDAFVSSAI